MIGGCDGTRAEGGLNLIVGRSKALGRVALGRFIMTYQQLVLLYMHP